MNENLFHKWNRIEKPHAALESKIKKNKSLKKLTLKTYEKPTEADGYGGELTWLT